MAAAAAQRKTRAELVGLKEANRALRNLPELVRNEVQSTMDATAFHFARLASSAAPRKTGTLASAIDWQSRPRSLSAVVRINTRMAFYWKFQEYGTKNHGAHPFLRPTAIRMREDHHQRLVAGLERAGNRMARDAASSIATSRVL